jgi:hypothetical protein
LSIHALIEGLVSYDPIVRSVVFCDEEGEEVVSAVSSEICGAAQGPEAIFVFGASMGPLVQRLQKMFGAHTVSVEYRNGHLWIACMRGGYYLAVLMEAGDISEELRVSLHTVASALETELP